MERRRKTIRSITVIKNCRRSGKTKRYPINTIIPIDGDKLLYFKLSSCRRNACSGYTGCHFRAQLNLLVVGYDNRYRHSPKRPFLSNFLVCPRFSFLEFQLELQKE